MMEIEKPSFILTVAFHWEKQGLGSLIPVDQLPDAILKRQADLTSQSGNPVSEVSALASILADNKMGPEQRSIVIGKCCGVNFPPSLV